MPATDYLAPDEFADLLDTPEFKTLRPAQRAAVFDAGLKDSEAWLRENNALDAQSWQQTAMALGSRYRPAEADIELDQQSALGTAVNAFKNLGPDVVQGVVGGVAKMADAASEMVGLSDPNVPSWMDQTADFTEELQQQGRIIRPLNPANPTAATIGSGAGQAVALLGTAGASLPVLGARAMTAVPAAMGFAMGAGSGIDTAEAMGITSPAARLGMGTAFGAIEGATEMIGGIGGRFIPTPKGLPGMALAPLMEGGEEMLSQAAQDATIAGVGQFMTDPNRPGFTQSGYELPAFNAAMLERQKQAAIGGAAGGAVFAGVQALSPSTINPEPSTNDGLPPNQTPAPTGAPQTPGATPGAAPLAGAAGPLPSTLSRIAQESLVPDLPEDTGALTADEVQDLEGVGQSMSDPSTTPPAQTFTGSNVQMGTEMPVPSPTAQAGAGTGAMGRVPAFADDPLTAPVTESGDVINDLRIPRSPAAIAESQRLEQQRLTQQAKLRQREAQAGRGPLLPDSPLGVYDILDFVNENKIRVPRADSAQRRAGDYDWTETYSVPQYYRKFLGSSERGGSIDQVAQQAFENGFIREPTADALMGAIQQGIDTRKQYRVQFAARNKAQAQVEKQTLDFEKTQQTLRQKDKDQVRFEDIAPGDEMTIDGEQAVVKNIEYTEDGYLTNVVIEDGKRFGLMQFDAQNRQGIFVDEFTPKQREQPGTAEEPLFSQAASGTSGNPSTINQPSSTPLQSPAELTANQKANEAILKSLGLPTKKGTRVWGAAKVKAALAKLSTDDRYPATTRLMARELSKLSLDNLLLKIEADARLNWAGLYQPFTDGRGELSLNTRTMGRGDLDIGISLVHEALHHATYRNLRSPRTARQKQAKTDLEALFKRAKAALAANERLSQFDYELSSMDEFITGLFTRADFQAALADIPSDMAPTLGQRVRSVLDEIFRVLAELVTSKAVPPGSVLEASMAATLRLMEDGTPSLQSRLGNALMTQGPGPITILQRALRAVKAYHGTPHKVDKFSTAKIGTGEGAQAYGWGLYFAQEAKVAEEYQQKLTQDDFTADGVRLPPGAINGKPGGMNYDWWNAYYISTEGLDSARKRAESLAGERLASFNKLAKQRIERLNTGNLYTVKLLPDEADFLDWDKPLAMQSEKVKEALKATGLFTARDLNPPPNFVPSPLFNSGRGAYELLSSNEGSPQKASELLASLGIAGINYFDRNSRNIEFGTRNFVVFEDKHIRITEANGQPVAGWNNSAELPALQNPAAAPSRAAAAPNETQSRFASPNEAARVINGPRTDAMVADQARRWLDSVDTQTAVEQFVAQAVPLPLDAAEHAAAVLISRLTSESTTNGTEVERLWAHVQSQRMARVWTREFLSADPARALRQRGVVNNTILQPIAPVMAAQGNLVDRADAVMDKRFEGGGTGAVEKVTKIVEKVDAQTGTDVAADLDADTEGSAGTPARPNSRKAAVKAKHPNLKKLLDALRKKMLPGMTWSDIFMDLPSTQKERQRQIYARLLKDERLRNLNADERLALTNELDKAWQRERRKVFNRELEKAGVLGEKDKTDRVKVQKALPKLLRMINLGMFNSEMWREAVAPEYGLRMLTAADTAQLRTLAEAAWKLPEGVIRNQKLRDLLNAIQKKTGASWIEVLNSYWTAAVLSGLRTQFDTWLAAINGMGTNLMQIGGLMARGQGRAAIDAHAQWWRGLFEGVRESGQILFKGDTSYLKRFGADLKKALEGETSVTPVPLGENLWKNGNTFQKYGLAPVMMFTGRLMAAADHINNTATTQGAIAVARALHPELYQGRVGFTASERADARTQALREVTGGAAPKPGQERATVSARTREILNGTVKPADYAAASEIGNMAAYQNDPTGVFGIIYSAMKQGLGSIQRGLGEYAQDVTANRFYRVISGVMAGSLHGITGTRFMRFGANFGADLTRYIPGSYVLGRAGFYGRDVSRMQQELLLGKNLVGLMLASTLAAIFLNSDDEDEGWQIEGDWSTLNPQQAKERMAAGYERLTMWKREGGKVRRVSYKQWPTMGLFAVVGGMLDEKRHKPASWAERGAAGHLLRGVATGYTQVKNVSAVRNLVELFGEPSFSSDKVTSTIDQMIKTGTGFAGGFMPTLIKDAEAWTDPRNFKPEGAAELMLRSMPIARKFVNDGRPQLNLLGEEVKLQRTPWSRAYTSVESGEAHRVLGALLARGLALPMPSDEVTVIKDNVRVPLETLGRDAVWRYEKAVGQGYKDWLSLEGSDLLKLPVQEADARIKARSAAIKARAKASVVK
jgi:hypothetical protein